ncbi:MAG: 4Fe-4S dicluster domain-containing protein [Gammaproteobacteria bacterium]|nr:MAG: 4Fe-4S dicluster domain-containing protein [Gammaproteobacteria bacterium]
MSNKSSFDSYRRRFLGGVASTVAGMGVAPGVVLHSVGHAKPAGDAVTGDVRWGMLIDTNKCAAGCDDCVKACDDEHGLTGFDRPETDAQWIRKVTLKDKQTGHTQTLPLLCQHCEKPPCVDVCPTGASFRREDGIVLVDKHICIGCRYCMMACPYKARSFVHETLQDQKPFAPRGKGTVESCTFCVHRVDNDRTPACVEACTAENHNAMVFGDMNDPDSELSRQLKKYNSRQIRADLELNTGVRYRGI